MKRGTDNNCSSPHKQEEIHEIGKQNYKQRVNVKTGEG